MVEDPSKNDIQKTKEANINDGIAGKDGDDSMTVVVPPSKAPKQPAPATDAEGDVAMDIDNAEGKEEKVDPAVQAVAGKQKKRIQRWMHRFLL